MSSVKVAFLYSEIAGYFLANVRQLSKEAEVLIFRWPINDEAPFNFEPIEGVQILDRSKFTQPEIENKLNEFNPSILVCSGWMDKGYVRAAKSFNKRIPVVLSLDNHWLGSIKQRIASLVSPFYLKKIFTHAWVPGEPQAIFANKLSFKDKHLLLNFYCADSTLFKGVYDGTFELKKTAFPKRFLYVARYVEHKGIFEMWEAYKQLKQETGTDWELWCMGTGEEWERRVESEGIKHLGFIQPNEMLPYIKDTGVYILPSKFEPWGVSVQEFAISGYPLLVSKEIGSKTKYLTEENGFEFEAGNVDDIKRVMKKVIELSETELINMAEKSHEVGMSFTVENWVNNLMSTLK